EDSAGRGSTIRYCFHAILLKVDAAFVIARRIAVEACRDKLIGCRVRQEISGDLLDHELVEWHVEVQCIDYPVAIFPDRARGVDAIAVRIGIARQIEPVPAPTLPVVG